MCLCFFFLFSVWVAPKKLILFDKKTTHYALSAVPDAHIADPLAHSVAFLSVAPMAQVVPRTDTGGRDHYFDGCHATQIVQGLVPS